MATNLSNLEIEPETQYREVEGLTKGKDGIKTTMIEESVPFDESLDWLLELFKDINCPCQGLFFQTQPIAQQNFKFLFPTSTTPSPENTFWKAPHGSL